MCGRVVMAKELDKVVDSGRCDPLVLTTVSLNEAHDDMYYVG